MRTQADNTIFALEAMACSLRDAAGDEEGDMREAEADMLDDAARLVTALAEIHEVMDGTEWSADTLEDIARIVVNAGFTIREPEEHEDED